MLRFTEDFRHCCNTRIQILGCCMIMTCLLTSVCICVYPTGGAAVWSVGCVQCELVLGKMACAFAVQPSDNGSLERGGDVVSPLLEALILEPKYQPSLALPQIAKVRMD